MYSICCILCICTVFNGENSHHRESEEAWWCFGCWAYVSSSPVGGALCFSSGAEEGLGGIFLASLTNRKTPKHVLTDWTIR